MNFSTCISDRDIIKTRQVHLHCEAIKSHSHLFYNEYTSYKMLKSLHFIISFFLILILIVEAYDQWIVKSMVSIFSISSRPNWETKIQFNTSILGSSMDPRLSLPCSLQPSSSVYKTASCTQTSHKPLLPFGVFNHASRHIKICAVMPQHLLTTCPDIYPGYKGRDKSSKALYWGVVK